MGTTPQGVLAPTAQFGWPTLDVNLAKILALNKSLMDAQFSYGLGSKIDPIELQALEVPRLKRQVDCSGEARWLVYHATNHRLLLPDGSFNQHAWFAQHGFKISSPQACLRKDGVLRVGFLSPEEGHGIGHVAFIANAMTIESHGHHGPDSRPFVDSGWMDELHVFVAALPEGS